jgi:general secretion pathway protein I
MKNSQKNSGFSLLEILVALAIFSVVSVASYHQINAISNTAVRLEEKYYAIWVGKNILEQYLINRNDIYLGEDIIEYKMAGREWHVKTLVKNYDVSDIFLLETSVYKNKNDKDPTITLTRVIGKN